MTHDENNKDQVILSQREVIQALKAKAERLEAENIIQRDEIARVREDLRAMTEAKNHAVSEATRHFDARLAADATVRELAEALGEIGDEARRVLIESGKDEAPVMMAPWVAGTAYSALSRIKRPNIAE